MARYEHLPIFREAYDLTVHLEKIVRNFSRYHKYTLGTDLRNQSRRILALIVQANDDAEKRAALLLELRRELEGLKVLARLCQDSGAFANTRSYLHVAERITHLARQNEGWLKQTEGRSSRLPPGRPWTVSLPWTSRPICASSRYTSKHANSTPRSTIAAPVRTTSA